MTSGVGRAGFAVLLAQDLAVIPLLLLISILGANSGGSLFATVGTALLQAALALAAIVIVGRALLRPLMRQVARTRSSELFIAAILFVVVAMGVVAALANLSMALGAFVAGLLLAETEYRKAIESAIAPFKGLLLGIFFFTVGMGIDVRELVREPLALVASVAGLLLLKAAIVVALCRLFHLSWPVTVEAALLLAAGGEFAFVGIGLARSLGVLPAEAASFYLAVTSLSMALIPGLAVLGRGLARRLEGRPAPDPEVQAQPHLKERHAIVVGHGRVGKVVCGLLARHGVAYTAVDHDAGAVAADRRRGHDVYFGNAADPAFLKACGIDKASGVVVTIHTQAAIDAVVRLVRQIRPGIPIVARARDAEHARHLYAIGVTDAVPETIEASLQLSEAALVGLGIPTGPVIASIHERRDEFRHALQDAATAAGLDETRSVKAKTGRGERGGST